MNRSERQQCQRGCDDGAHGDDADEPHRLAHAQEAPRHADVPHDERGDGVGLEARAAGDDRGREHIAFDRQIRGEAAEPYSGPERGAGEEQRTERDAGRRPYRGGVAGRDGEQERELRRRKVDGGEQR